MQKKDIIRLVVSGAEEYHLHLENRNLLFLFGNPDTPETMEAVFHPRNFLHLTGLRLSTNRIRSSTEFYSRCLRHRLSPDDFWLPEDGTAEMKLQILPGIMKIHQSAKMAGDYESTKIFLYTEKLVGNISACLGFTKEGQYYIPNTALREDIRNVTRKPALRMLAILRKPIRESVYHEICYAAKGIDASALLQNAGTSVPQDCTFAK